MSTVGPAEIRAARARIAGQIVETPFLQSRTLSTLTGADVWLKFENLQFTGSFKDRGALNRLLALSEDEKRAGVIAMSAGNHAQGVAYHAGRLGIPATIVMPEGTPFTKVNSTAVLGAEVLIHGADIEAAAAFATEERERRNLTFIHPYDDPHVIAGQGTVGLEILDSGVALDDLIVPIGGGGLISGIALAMKDAAPGLSFVGVEAERVPSMRQAVYGDASSEASRTIADGIAVKAPGALTRPIIEANVADILLVSESALERAVLLLLEIEKTVAEGAGAAALAALIEHEARFAGRRVGILISGGNIDPRLLSSIMLGGLVRTGRIARLALEVPDRPGALASVANIVARAQANILEVFHQRAFSGLSVTTTGIILVLETRNEAHVDEIVAELVAAGHAVTPVPLGDPAIAG